jgi:hypothetical protein
MAWSRVKRSSQLTVQLAESPGRSSGSSSTIYNSAAQVFDHANGTRFVWTTDLLPDELAPNVDTMMTAGIAAIKKTIEDA